MVNNVTKVLSLKCNKKCSKTLNVITNPECKKLLHFGLKVVTFRAQHLLSYQLFNTFSKLSCYKSGTNRAVVIMKMRSG